MNYPPRYRDTPSGSVAAYAPESQGPFRCDHCRFQWFLRCGKPEVVKEFILLRHAPVESRVTVEAGGCCDYFKRGTAPR